MLTDALALGLGLFAMSIAKRPVTQTKTYGYYRAEIMAALANGAILILVSGYIFYEAYRRFNEVSTVNAQTILLVASIGLVANLAGIFLLHRESRSSLNVKAAFWHIVGDTMSSVGVIIAGVIILVTGWYVVDPIIAVIIGLVILWGAFRIVREAADILLESVPKHIDLAKVAAGVRAIPGVRDLHDIHIWTITSGIYAISAHLSIEDQTVSQSTEIVSAVNQLLAKDFNITHITLQLECESCPSGLICNLCNPE
jgi:cobalt-zinc-cadmium efflux system protein